MSVKFQDKVQEQIHERIQGPIHGPLQGQLQGQLQGPLQRQFQGQLQGSHQGQFQGPPQGQLQGPLQGQLQGPLQGQLQGPLQGQLQGQLHGQIQDEATKSIRQDTKALVHKVGERLTGGNPQNGYLAMYLRQLQRNPLRTKMLTSGVLSALQEYLASWIADDSTKNGLYFSARVPKMLLYGMFISAPLGHFLVGILQKVFAGRTSLKAKVLQILASNLIVSPIQNVVYLSSMAVITGARTFHQVRATIRAGFMPVMKVSWITSPVALAFAQKFLPEHTWVPFFNIIGFIIGTYVNAHTKRKRLEALRKRYNRGPSSEYEPKDYR
ncbi:hypothetical protein BDV28DRAFT_74885 [Aspergillus coremiiformis]|uniref:Integral membrane protein 25D9-6 n=1 Tax=Aspergillus coremiiformis TaxID=138285 RepID=A0A5N6YW49_9EURO|nr:hypothetical protein BDV28DRAFT_74885 [Aspergillus coremiiformis]